MRKVKQTKISGNNRFASHSDSQSVAVIVYDYGDGS